MYQTRILNEKEVLEFNNKYNTDYKIIHIQQRNNKYYAILDCSLKKELKPKEVLNYFNK
jgi:hypothetical protein